MSHCARWRLELAEYIPEDLAPGVLYVSKEYETAVHLCACGCGEQVVTPLISSGWTFSDGPTLAPSIGSFSLPCRSHYWIRNGETVWT